MCLTWSGLPDQCGLPVSGCGRVHGRWHTRELVSVRDEIVAVRRVVRARSQVDRDRDGSRVRCYYLKRVRCHAAPVSVMLPLTFATDGRLPNSSESETRSSVGAASTVAAAGDAAAPP